MSSSNPLQDAAAIVGIGQTEFAKPIDRPEAQLAAEAVVAALRDAGIAPVRGGRPVARSPWRPPTRSPWPRPSGPATSPTSPRSATAGVPAAPPSATPPWPSPPARPTWWWPGARASGGPGRRGPGRRRPSRLPIQAQWTRPFGLLRPVDEVAMLARRYMLRVRGRRASSLAEVAMAVRAHANRNPAALMYDKPMTLDDYMDGPLHLRAAVPLRQLPGDRRRAGRRAGLGRPGQGLPAPAGAGPRLRPGPAPPARVDGQLLLRRPADRAGLGVRGRSCGPSPSSGPADVDVAQIYDAFTPLILLSLEGYGFCRRGEAGDFVADGNLRWGSGVPAHQHLGRRAVRGLRARLQPHHRGGAPAAGHLDQPGSRCPHLPGHLGRGRADQRAAAAAAA